MILKEIASKIKAFRLLSNMTRGRMVLLRNLIHRLSGSGLRARNKIKKLTNFTNNQTIRSSAQSAKMAAPLKTALFLAKIVHSHLIQVLGILNRLHPTMMFH